MFTRGCILYLDIACDLLCNYNLFQPIEYSQRTVVRIGIGPPRLFGNLPSLSSHYGHELLVVYFIRAAFSSSL